MTEDRMDEGLLAEKTMYVLDAAGKPVHPRTIREWGAFMEDVEKRRVARTELPGGIVVSTVFLAMNHAWDDGPPVLWETMVFGGEGEGEERECERWRSREEAEKGHERIAEEWRRRRQA